MRLFNDKNYTPPSPGTIPPYQVILQPDRELRDERRPCWVHGRKALFHRWASTAHPLLPRGVQPGENSRYYQYRCTYAIVEYMDGTVERVYANELQFADGGGFDKFEWCPMAQTPEEKYGDE